MPGAEVARVNYKMIHSELPVNVLVEFDCEVEARTSIIINRKMIWSFHSKLVR